MSGFFKKAISLFVEIDENTTNGISTIGSSDSAVNSKPTIYNSKSMPSNDEMEKFENHFEKLLVDSNFEGPDYFEFCKMNESLEQHIADEKVRFVAVFESLKTQGITKNNLILTADKYKSILNSDKGKFEAAVNDKMRLDVEARKTEMKNLEQKMQENSELIKKLSKEIADSQITIQSLNDEINQNETKIKTNMSGYNYAFDAIINKINIDIQKLQNLL